MPNYIYLFRMHYRIILSIQFNNILCDGYEACLWICEIRRVLLGKWIRCLRDLWFLGAIMAMHGEMQGWIRGKLRVLIGILLGCRFGVCKGWWNCHLCRKSIILIWALHWYHNALRAAHSHQKSHYSNSKIYSTTTQYKKQPAPAHTPQPVPLHWPSNTSTPHTHQQHNSNKTYQYPSTILSSSIRTSLCIRQSRRILLLFIVVCRFSMGTLSKICWVCVRLWVGIRGVLWMILRRILCMRAVLFLGAIPIRRGGFIGFRCRCVSLCPRGFISSIMYTTRRPTTKAHTTTTPSAPEPPHPPHHTP